MKAVKKDMDVDKRREKLAKELKVKASERAQEEAGRQAKAKEAYK